MTAAPHATEEAYALVGEETVRVSDRVSLRNIKEYLAATDEAGSGMRQSDLDALDDSVVPPRLFILAAIHRIAPQHRLLEDGQYDDLTVPGLSGTSILAGWDIEFGVPLMVDDVITSREVIESIEERQGRSGTLLVVRRSSSHHNQRGDLLATDVQTIIYR